MDPYLYLFIRLLPAFFLFFCQDANKTESNCAKIGCNLSKKHKLTLYKTQSGEPNFVDHKFLIFCQELPVQKLGDRHLNTKEPVSWLVHVLCDFKATVHQEASFSLEYTIKIHLADIFYLFGVSPPSIFPLQFRYIYLYILQSQN